MRNKHDINNTALAFLLAGDLPDAFSEVGQHAEVWHHGALQLDHTTTTTTTNTHTQHFTGQLDVVTLGDQSYISKYNFLSILSHLNYFYPFRIFYF